MKDFHYTFPGVRIDPPLKSAVGARSANLLIDVLAQFDVVNAPRYKRNQQGRGETYCNIFVWDFGIAMGSEIPHKIPCPTCGGGRLVGGRPCTRCEGMGTVEQNANAMCRWLTGVAAVGGSWRVLTPEEARRWACDGKPAVATWMNEPGIGHVAAVLPSASGVYIAQAGAENLFNVTLARTFPDPRAVILYGHP